MKKILFFTALLYVVSLNAQGSKIGSTRAEIKNEFSENVFTDGVTTDGVSFITCECPIGYFTYYFNNDGDELCDWCALSTFSLTDANTMIEHHNNNFVVMSDIWWKVYHENGNITNVRLKVIVGIYTFYYTKK